MKNWTLLILGMSAYMLKAQNADTLFTAHVLANGLDPTEERTSIDTVVHSIGDVASYLQKDSRFQVRQYAPGSIATMNLGGANSTQSRIMWEGIDISSMASGVLDLSIVPSVLVTAESVASGSNAFLSSDKAMIGGLRLGWATSAKPFFSTSFAANTIGLRSMVVQNGGKLSKIRYRSFIKTEQSSNDYPYTIGNNDFRMKGMEYSTLTLLQRYEGKLGRVKWNANIWYTDALKNNRGSILTSGTVKHLEDRILRGIVSTQKRDWKGSLFYGKEWQSYTDTISNINLRDTNTYDQLTLRLVKLGKRRQSSISGSYIHAGGTSRQSTLLQATANHKQFIGKTFNTVWRGTYWNSKVYGGAQLNWIKDWKTTCHQVTAGSFYRVPTINELFWSPGGNPDLKAEQSYGIKYSVQGKIGAVNTYFTTDQLYHNNLIQWTPGTNGMWQPENIEIAYTSSSSVISKYSSGKWSNELSLTHQYSRVLEAILSGNEGKSLLYRPDWNAVHTLTYDTPKIDFQLRTNYLGKRQTLRDNSSSGELSREVWADLSCASTVLSKVKILFAVHNITNADRTFFLNYPMPGRHYSLTIQIHSK